VDQRSGSYQGFGRGWSSLSLPWQLGERVDDRIRHHPTGVVMIPENRIQAIVHYAARTPTHGHLREAFVVPIEPMGSDSTDCAPPRDPSLCPGKVARRPSAEAKSGPGHKHRYEMKH
jgi:hypothetical protein